MRCVRVCLMSVFLAVLVLISNGCAVRPQLVGSGNPATDKRDVAAFTIVRGGGAIHVEVAVGEQPSLEVTADDNLIPHILTEVDNGVLTINTDGVSYQSRLGIRVKATVKELTGMNLSGASNGKVTGIAGETFAADASGASKINLAGTVADLTVKCNGASTVNALDLVAQKVNASANGASHIEVTAKASLDASANGASSIRFAGDPPAKNVSANGASSVKAK
jgi:hypothetical protein